MNKIYYPAIFQPETIGYSVWLYDIDGCISQGDTFNESIDNIKDALGLFVEDYIATKTNLPTPTLPENIKLEKNQFFVIVEFDWIEYDKKRIKNSDCIIYKTLTIPNWLNTIAESYNINFSKTLQEALKQQLHLQ